MNAAVADDAQVDAGAPRTPPRGLLLDFGAVISRSLFECHRDTERQLGLPAGTLTWLGPLDPSTDPLWRALQRQQISERDYWRCARASSARRSASTTGTRARCSRACATPTRCARCARRSRG